MKRAVCCVLGLWLGFAGAVWAAAEAEQPSRNRNVTFVSTSDCHYKTADSKTCHNDLNRASIEAMNAIATVRWPGQLGGESVSPPRGVVVLGDVIDDGDKAMPGRKISEEQNRFFLADFGLDGTDGLLKYPVFEGWGNHDGPSEGNEKNGFSFQGQLKKRNQVRKQKGLISNLSENGLHYSWDWDDVHFLQLNLYPADQQRKGVRYSPVWHDPQGSLTFLKKDLAEKVGTSGRPVVLMSHCGFDTDWWTPADWEEVYEAAKPYNVILYLYGHSGTGVLQWAPKGQERKWTCINDGQTEKGFFVIQITGDRLRAAMRVKANHKVTKDPDGTLHHQWDGKWEWKWPLDKTLALGPSTPTPEKKPTKDESPSVSPVPPVGQAEKDAAPSATIRVNLQEKNTLENPRRIVPQEQPLSNCAKRFSVTLPPQSVNLLRIPASAP